MNVLVTGVAGFIGSHLYRRLVENGHKVIGIDNLSHPCGQKVPYQYVDVRYFKEVLPFFSNCDVCFHLAAQISVDKSITNPEETIATNIIGTNNILECARRYKTTVVFASSSEIYGSSQMDYMAESHPLEPHSPYGAAKLAGDALCRVFYKTYGLDVVVVRNFNTFGEYQNNDSYGGVIAKFVKAALKDEDIVIYGSGVQERDYMHIKDALQGYEKAMMLPAGVVVNFGTGKTIRIIDLANKIVEMTGSKSKIVHAEERKGEVQRLCANITYARSFGFEPQTDFWKDLKRYVKWMKEE